MTFLECMGRAVMSGDDQAFGELLDRYDILPIATNKRLTDYARHFGGESVLEDFPCAIWKSLRNENRASDDRLTYIYKQLMEKVASGTLAADDEAGQLTEVRRFFTEWLYKEVAKYRDRSWVGKREHVWDEPYCEESRPMAALAPPMASEEAQELQDNFRALLERQKPLARAVVELRYYLAGLNEISESTLRVIQTALESLPQDERIIAPESVSTREIERLLAGHGTSSTGEAGYALISALCGVRENTAQKQVSRFVILLKEGSL